MTEIPKDPFAAVREFHTFFKQPVRDTPTYLEGVELALRRSLIDEEHAELEDAWLTSDLPHQYKELADLLYVVCGADQHMGNKLWEVFQEVHRSNMSKLWPCEQCDGTGVQHDSHHGDLSVEYHSDPCKNCGGTGKLPRYREDGKVLKNPDTYVPPDLSHIFEKET